MKKIQKTYSTFIWIKCVAAKINLMILILTGIQTFQGLATIVKAILLGQIINYVVAEDKQGFIYTLIGFISLVVTQIAFGAFYRYFNELTLAKMENRLKSRFFDAILRGSYSKISCIHSGEWVNRLTSDISVVAGTFVSGIPDLIGLLIRLIGALVAILLVEPKLVIFLFLGAFILVVLTRVFRRTMKKYHKQIQEADDRLHVFFQERLSNLLIIKTFVQEKRTIDLVDEYMIEHKNIRMKRNGLLNIFYSGYSIGINSIYILGIAFCGFGIMHKTMSYGDIIVVLQLLEHIQRPFASITGFLPRYYSMIASAERLIEVEEFEEEIDGNILESCQEFYDKELRAIVLKNVSFLYPSSTKNYIENKQERIVLKNFSLEINKGEHIVFTGPSGCGKSTVLKILMSLHTIDSGEVYMLTNKGKYQMTPIWRRLYTYVPQGNQLLSGTIREIIAFNDEDGMRNEEKINLALKIACADDFVNILEKGIDTILEEKGAGLSEGQMQRIAIARAIFSGHPILLFDEVTSAIDEETSNKILYNLKNMTDKTIIMVTHRTRNMQTFSKKVIFSKEKIEVIDLKMKGK